MATKISKAEIVNIFEILTGSNSRWNSISEDWKIKFYSCETKEEVFKMVSDWQSDWYSKNKETVHEIFKPMVENIKKNVDKGILIGKEL